MSKGIKKKLIYSTIISILLVIIGLSVPVAAAVSLGPDVLNAGYYCLAGGTGFPSQKVVTVRYSYQEDKKGPNGETLLNPDGTPQKVTKIGYKNVTATVTNNFTIEKTGTVSSACGVDINQRKMAYVLYNDTSGHNNAHGG